MIEDRCDIDHFVRFSAEDARCTCKLISFAQPPRTTTSVGYYAPMLQELSKAAMSKSQNRRFIGGVCEIGRADSAIFACLTRVVAPKRSGLVVADRGCSHAFVRARPGCLSEQIVQHMQAYLCFVLIVTVDSVFYEHVPDMVDFRMAMQSFSDAGVAIAHVSAKIPSMLRGFHV